MQIYSFNLHPDERIKKIPELNPVSKPYHDHIFEINRKDDDTFP